MALSILSALLVASAEASVAYPIPPVPLRKLVLQAEIIVVASVEEVTPPAESEGVFGSTAVRLAVSKYIKGDGEETLHVVTNEHVICPTPARYRPNTQVLAFLKRLEATSNYETCSLSYGAKQLRPVALKRYAERITELQAVEQTTDSSERLRKELDWIVACAVDPITRWEGAYELCPTSADGEFWEAATAPDWTSMLRNDQREQLRDALLRSSKMDDGDSCLERLLAKDSDPRLQAWLVGILRQLVLDSPGDRNSINDVLQRIAMRDKRESVRALVDEYEKEAWGHPRTDENRARCEAVLTKFLKQFE